MFINIGGEASGNTEDDNNVGDRNRLSTEEVMSLCDYDPADVEFVISSSDSETNWSFERLPLPNKLCEDSKRPHSSHQSVFLPPGNRIVLNRSIWNSHPSHTVRKYQCQSDDEITKTDAHLNQALPPDQHCLDKTGVHCLRWRRFRLIRSPIKFLSSPLKISELIEKPVEFHSENLDEVIHILESCNHLSSRHLQSLLTRLSIMPPTRLRNHLTRANGQRTSGQIAVLSDFLQSPSDTRPKSSSSWSFGNALIFCTSVVTTIGYGHIVPQTPAGKVFCIAFGSLGIPFTLHLSSFTISLVMPLILRWRAVTVRFFVSRFPSPRGITSSPRIPRMLTFEHNSTGDAQKNTRIFDSLPTTGVVQSQPKADLEESRLFKVELPFHSGKVNHSFAESDLTNSPSYLKLRRKSKSLTSLHSDLRRKLHCSKIADNIRKHTTIVLPATNVEHHEALVDNEVLAAAAARLKLLQNHCSTVSKTSALLDTRSHHVSVVQPPLTLREKLHALRKNRSTRARLFHLIMVVILVFVLILFVPAYVFMQLEPDWSYLDSVYFCFISLTTIGFGDFVPGRGTLQGHTSNGTQSYKLAHEAYNIAIVVYLVVGTTMLMLLVRVYREMMEVERRIKRDRLILKLQHSLTDPNMTLSNTPLCIPP
ncbi:potassium channel subfamily K [Echinococcus multilocularis]|uniref:Potassium channel subfamily K n=1 Tax=Echinococcus multilocularis TaxID=6211 RepID=A0A087VXV7_ECHMU|nr:potassium channel subfamily K [Echinococcus multilocularis]